MWDEYEIPEVALPLPTNFLHTFYASFEYYTKYPMRDYHLANCVFCAEKPQIKRVFILKNHVLIRFSCIQIFKYTKSFNEYKYLS